MLVSTVRRKNIFQHLDLDQYEELSFEEMKELKKDFTVNTTFRDWAKENNLSMGNEVPYYLTNKELYWFNPDDYVEIVLFKHYGKWYIGRVYIYKGEFKIW